MYPSWIDHLPPELLAPAAWILLSFGLIFWFAGGFILRRIAVAFAALIGLWFGAVLALHFNSPIPPLALALIGGTLGVLAGIFLFRLYQALIVALLVGITTAALFGWFFVHSISSAAIIKNNDASALLIQIPQDSQPASWVEIVRQPGQVACNAWAALQERAGGVPPLEIKKIAAVGAIFGLLAFFFCWRHPFAAARTVGGLLGSAILLSAAVVLLHLRRPGSEHFLAAGILRPLFCVAALTTLSCLIQCRIFRSPPDKPQESKMPAAPPSH